MSNLSREEAEEILKKEYVRENFLALIEEFIPDYIDDYHQVGYSGKIFKSVIQLGKSTVCNLKIYEVALGDGTLNSRVAITQEMFRVLKEHTERNALISFIGNDTRNYRISLLTSKYEMENDTVTKVLSDPRRYSYSLGYGTKTKTAYDFLISKGKVNSLDELKERFSVEVVNKMFYKEIAKQFTQLVGGETYDNIKFDKVLKIKGVDDKNKDVEFAVRLIGRIIFCWFLKEKKSIQGISLIPEAIFSNTYVKAHKNYYHKVLEPLFYEVLNTPIEERKNWINSCDIYNTIPYLNGGLFSPHNDDHYMALISDSDNSKGDVHIPDKWFSDFFEILNQYNFTVDENTSYDVELSIDPEMLGRIFENLLAEINPETGESARNNTGSFYTPREIVDFMVDNSLTQYLVKNTGINIEKIESLVSYNKDDEKLNFESWEKKSIIDAIYTATVLDPACGSGAFPIGMLQKMVYVLQTIDADAKLWFDRATRNLSGPLKADLRKNYDEGSLDYIRKLTVIQNSIFGVDIQPIAVEIARLRCFLSLIIEEKVSDEEPNRGGKPLPNLEFKFVIANTLLDLGGESLKYHQTSMFVDESYTDELKDVREQFFNASDCNKKDSLKNQFIQIQRLMRDSSKENSDVGALSLKSGLYSVSRKTNGNLKHKSSIEDANKIASKYYQLSFWDPFSNGSSDWFNPKWMFGVNGFDIVIGNPPYIQLQKDGGKLSKLYENSGYVSFSKMGDIYCLFYERGCQLLKNA